MLTKRFLLASAVALAGVLALQPTTAQALAPALPDAAERATTDLLNKFDVSPQQQPALLAAAASNSPWDVYRPGTVPVSTEHRSIDGFFYTVNRFADGSFSAFGLETPVDSEARTSPLHAVDDPAITQCTYATGSGYQSVTGCQIDGVWGTVVVGAIGVDYTLVDRGLDRITDYGYGYQQCLFPTSCSSPRLVLSQDGEESTAAHGRWQADVSASWGSWNVWVQLNVADDSAWQSNS